eukprot:1923819-Pyramimonas_sp.AAC.1
MALLLSESLHDVRQLGSGLRRSPRCATGIEGADPDLLGIGRCVASMPLAPQSQGSPSRHWGNERRPARGIGWLRDTSTFVRHVDTICCARSECGTVGRAR